MNVIEMFRLYDIYFLLLFTIIIFIILGLVIMNVQFEEIYNLCKSYNFTGIHSSGELLINCSDIPKVVE